MGRPKEYSDEFRRRAVDEVGAGPQDPRGGWPAGHHLARDVASLGTPGRGRPGSARSAHDRRAGGDQEAAQGGGRPAAHDRNPQGGDRFFRPGAEPPLTVRVAFIDAHRDRWPVAVIAEALDGQRHRLVGQGFGRGPLHLPRRADDVRSSQAPGSALAVDLGGEDPCQDDLVAVFCQNGGEAVPVRTLEVAQLERRDQAGVRFEPGEMFGGARGPCWRGERR